MNDPTTPAPTAASVAVPDAELSRLVAERVAGWTSIQGNPLAGLLFCGFNESQGKTSAQNAGSRWGIPARAKGNNMSKIKLTVYQRIFRALKKGKGLRLSPKDVWDLCQDDAIETRAQKDSENQAGFKDGDLY